MKRIPASRTQTTARRSLLALAMTALATLPSGNAVGAVHATALTAANQATTSKTFKGTVEQMHQWGPMQVSSVVVKKKITKVLVSATAHSGRSVIIQNGAIPILKRETLKAQSAKIDAVSGATDMSEAYTTSLQAAITSARAAKALK